MSPRRGDSAGVTPASPIGRLIDEQRKRNDWSYGDLEARSGKNSSGRPVISDSNWQAAVRRVPRAFPAPATMRAMARALDVPEYVIVEKYAQSLGLRFAADGGLDVTAAIDASTALSEDQKRTLKGLYAMLSEQAPVGSD